jgi:hypothetical protein
MLYVDYCTEEIIELRIAVEGCPGKMLFDDRPGS